MWQEGASVSRPRVAKKRAGVVQPPEDTGMFMQSARQPTRKQAAASPAQKPAHVKKTHQ